MDCALLAEFVEPLKNKNTKNNKHLTFCDASRRIFWSLLKASAYAIK